MEAEVQGLDWVCDIDDEQLRNDEPLFPVEHGDADGLNATCEVGDDGARRRSIAELALRVPSGAHENESDRERFVFVEPAFRDVHVRSVGEGRMDADRVEMRWRGNAPQDAIFGIRLTDAGVGPTDAEQGRIGNLQQ